MTYEHAAPEEAEKVRRELDEKDPVTKALRKLSSKDQDVIVCRILKSWTFSQIGEHFKEYHPDACPNERALEMRYYRALERLKKELNKQP